jgi:GntR family histidine utilization transcriptional repressor
VSGSEKPRYQQLKELIIERISSGELQPRDRVPSENELVDATGVSRMTANRALRELNDEGVVERVAGKGTFVAELKADSHLLEVRNIADEIRQRGHRHTARVLLLEARDVTPDLAELLHTQDNVAHALVVHCENEVPIQVEDRYVAGGFAPAFLEQDFSIVTPGAYLNGISPLQEAEHVVRAAMPDSRIRNYLAMPEGEPCLVVIRRTWAHGRPVSFARLHHPGSRFELSGEFASSGARQSARQSAQQTDIPNAGIDELRTMQ